MSLNVMIPNMLTLLALCSGLTSIRFALNDRWEAAVLAVAVAALLDALDGRVARMLKGASKFGAELDSLSDFVCFGVVPALLLYLWGLEDTGRFSWILVLLLSACCGMRLARFNTMLDDPDAPPFQVNYFTGVPAPAGAGLALLPIVLSLQFGDTAVRSPFFIAVVMIAVAALFVSKVPTFSFKKVKIHNDWFLPTMVIVVLLAAGLLSAPWATLSIILVLYIISIPMSYLRYGRQMRLWEAQHGVAAKGATKPPIDDSVGDPDDKT
ncbi:MAG: phosphatidylcholine/phosphatidylserine synthase [Rhodospirillales bacterium]